jgi:hypothetical protein
MTPASVNKRVDLSGTVNPKDLNTSRDVPGQADRVFPILWSLKRALAYPHKIFDFNDLDDKLFGFIYELRELKISSLDQLNDLWREIQNHFDATGEDTWHGHHKATIRKAQNRFKGLQDKLGGLLADGSVDFGTMPQVDYAFTANELRVVDISACNSNAVDLIVNSTINAIWKLAEKGEMGVDKLIVFVDELNKYAPAGGEGGLRDTLVDIAARGRHLNVVLLGAQQFRSRVDGEILGNCGTSFYGRIGDEEIINAAYRSISDTSKQELLGLAKGRLLVRHAHFRAPLFGTFPLPPTIPGAFGQRIFGREDNQATHPADGLCRTLRKIMKDKCPPVSEIKTFADELDGGKLDEIASMINKMYQGGQYPIGRAWETAKKQINTARALRTMS